MISRKEAKRLSRLKQRRKRRNVASRAWVTKYMKFRGYKYNEYLYTTAEEEVVIGGLMVRTKGKEYRIVSK